MTVLYIPFQKTVTAVFILKHVYRAVVRHAVWLTAERIPQHRLTHTGVTEKSNVAFALFIDTVKQLYNTRLHVFYTLTAVATVVVGSRIDNKLLTVLCRAFGDFLLVSSPSANSRSSGVVIAVRSGSISF